MARRSIRVLMQTIVIVLLVVTLAGGIPTQPVVQAAPARLAYVFYGNSVDANAFQGMLLGSTPAYSVDLIPLSSVLTMDFSQYAMILIADDTGSLNAWGTSPSTAAQVAAITAPNKPILGIGEGGYAFFGQLNLHIGWPYGWHGPQSAAKKASTAPATTIWGSIPSPATLFATPVNSVGIYLTTVPADVLAVGLEPSSDDHADQVMQGCRFLWGSSGGPGTMTGDGKALFLSYLTYAVQYQCDPVPTDLTPDPKYLSVSKTADPVISTAVVPGQVMTYTLTYNFASDGLPGVTSAILKDQIPMDTVYVPNSASDGISPTPGGVLQWTLTPGSGTKTFKVIVSDTQCVDQRMVNNQAALKANGYTQVTSEQVYHPVTCPVVAFPNSSIFYAEDEVTVHPYPLIAGHTSEVSVRLTNTTGAASPVTVQFQAAPLGIGMIYTTFATQTATVPAYGVTLLTSPYMPTTSGQASFQILLSGSPPLFTQSNLDVSEDFKPGVEDTLTVPVRNNTLSPGTINLVVDNTCPGWTALVVPAQLTDVAAGATNNVSFKVTPPVGPPLGSGCHIDLQAWIGTTMIGGIRKLDVPPVHLPSHVNPPWEEPEIVPVPNPPVAGVAGQICIDLVNPLSYAKDVTVDFSVADFGAGIPFVPAVSKTFTLPANSSGRYCANWTPEGTGTLHKCILATLKQTGFLDMTSQRNVDIVRSAPTTLAGFSWPFKVGNPDGIPHALTFRITPVGIDPAWSARILTLKGDPAPLILGDGSVLDMRLDFVPAMAAQFGALAPAVPPAYRTGGESHVEVAVMLDGRQVGGFTLSMEYPQYLPIVRR